MVEKELFGKKKPNIREDANGDILVHVGSQLWIRQKDIPSKKEVREEFMRYSHAIIYKSEVILNISIPLIVIAIAVWLSSIYFKDKSFTFFLYEYLFVLLFYIVMRIKDIVIFSVKLYQIFTPMDIRCRCCFTPSCSDYMILAIKKYGLIIGLIKGIKRLKKCKGQREEDYP